VRSSRAGLPLPFIGSRRDEARAELARAASLAKNDRERAPLLKRAAS